MNREEKASSIARAITAYWQVKCEIMEKHPFGWLSGNHEKAAQIAYFQSLGYKVRLK